MIQQVSLHANAVWFQQDCRGAFFNDNLKKSGREASYITQPRKRLIKPASHSSNKTAVICACMMEEEANVDEWVDYNLGIGFSHIYIYDNTELFELEQWAQERLLVFNDPVTVVHDKRKGLQRQVYRECAELMFKKGHTWAFFVDVDEFLVVKDRKRFPHIVDYFQYQVPRGASAIRWRVFGTAGRKTFEPVPVTKKFQFRTSDDFKMNQQVKSVSYLQDYDFEKKKIKTPHYVPVVKGQKYGWADTEDAVIHHYRFKSWVEYVRKRKKGDVLFGFQRHVKEAEEGKTQHGDPIPRGTIFDDTAWQILKSVAPRYAVYDDFYSIPRYVPPGEDE